MKSHFLITIQVLFSALIFCQNWTVLNSGTSMNLHGVHFPTQSIRAFNNCEIYIPNSFTPNEDKLNDIFLAKGYGITEFNMQIFDRWGHKVFESTSINEGWDGKVMIGSEFVIEEGIFTFLINYSCTEGGSQQKTGCINVIK